MAFLSSVSPSSELSKTWGSLGGETVIPSVQEGTQFQLHVMYMFPCGCYNFSI